jgi:phage-related holin
MYLTQLCQVSKDRMEHLFTDNMSYKIATAVASFFICKVAGIPIIVIVAFASLFLEFALFLVKSWRFNQVNENKVRSFISHVTTYIIVIVAAYMGDHVIADIFKSFPEITNVFSGHHSITQLLAAFVFWAEFIAILKLAKDLGLPVPNFVIEKMENTHDLMNN